ncbi:hypothetical protein AB3U99_21725 [Niallia sp. JL1B1071]
MCDGYRYLLIDYCRRNQPLFLGGMLDLESVVIGRKARLISNTPQGAKASAILYSMEKTAIANGNRKWIKSILLPSISV